ncbi:CUG-BP- and ETR-3-like factor [Raphidocelis subcapitata]|uniref:CUG-BP-and ETR-3-like factor n=1 Tax=Raphidocelis subcapitata TaxID=307507 RepID=A0A2V0PAH7_9CHLO|nr:CUG-BP- and ETR-3-like factor [Raphidocelis subcapitata]|eukprot:GBF95952.1 CUG-BP- and ETR-3-like factor [Raphidocelis subcapitata]
MTSHETVPGEDAALAPELVRLYVAGIPKTMNEAQLKPLFDQWGAVRDVMILRERSSGLSRGCAFVGYESAEEAEAAIAHLDRRVHLPGAPGPLEVRFARGRQVASGSSIDEGRTLAFAGAPAGANESDLQALFSSHGGAVEALTLVRDESGESKGCGTVTLTTQHDAQAALKALSGKHTQEGAPPLTVRWADPGPASRRSSRASADGGPPDDVDDRTVFFARVLRSATEDAVRALFSRYGGVADINLFRAFQGAPTTKGCGLVTLGSVEEATSAIAALHETHVWPGMSQPMVVRWMDSALQRRRREEHLIGRQAAMLQPAPATAPWGAAPSSGTSSGGLFASQLQAQLAPAPAGLMPAHAGQADALLPFTGVPAEVPPPGCAPDAYKLFIGNVPSCYTERDLRPLFESVGPVVELVVLYDKQTGASKGSAFCWYASRPDADRAAAQFNERHLLPDPTGHQQRPLVVRPATVRRAVPRALLAGPQQGLGLGMGMGMGMNMGMGLSGAGALGAAAAAAAAGRMTQTLGLMPRSHGAGPGLGRVLHPMAFGGQGGDSGAGLSSGSFLLDGSGGADAALQSGGYGLGGGPGSGGPDSGGYAILSGGNAGGGGAGGGGAGGGAASWDAAGGGASPPLQYVPMPQPQALAAMQRAAMGGGGGGGGGGAGPDAGLSVQVPLLASQLHAVTPHVYNIQSASGAEVTTHAVAPGVFCLKVSGSKMAVDAASTLISSILQNTA